jgi:hypothetical protein
MDVLKDCVFAMKRLSDDTAGIIDPYKQSTIRKSSETYSHWNMRVQEKRHRDINTLIESLFFFINTEQERSKDARRMDWIEQRIALLDIGRVDMDHLWPDGIDFNGTPLRDAIDQAIALENDRTTPESSESQTRLTLETAPDSSRTEPSEPSPSE